MSRIRSTDSTIELTVRKSLFARGFRYRKNVKTMPGKPDIVLPKYRTVIFVHGCFWHGHQKCRVRIPKSRTDYWQEKIGRNIERDETNIKKLRSDGWQVLTVWECELLQETEKVINELEQKIRSMSNQVQTHSRADSDSTHFKS